MGGQHVPLAGLSVCVPLRQRGRMGRFAHVPVCRGLDENPAGFQPHQLDQPRQRRVERAAHVHARFKVSPIWLSVFRSSIWCA